MTSDLEARVQEPELLARLARRAPASPSPARARRRRRRRDHRSRVHRPVDRVRARPTGPDPANRGARSGDRRLRRLGAQRRLVLGALRGQPRGNREGTRARGGRRAPARAVRHGRRGRCGRRGRADRHRLPEGRDPRARDCGGTGASPPRRRSTTSGSGGSARRTCTGWSRRRHRRDSASPSSTARSTPRTAHGSIRHVSRGPRGGRGASRGDDPRADPRGRDLAPASADRRRPGEGGRGRARHRGLHRADPGTSARPRAALLVDDRHRAASRVRSGMRSAGRAARRSATAGTSSSTASAPRTTGSHSAGGARRTTSAVASATGSTATRRRSPSCTCPPLALPRAGRHADHPPVGWTTRRPARLVQLGRVRAHDRARVGRRLRRRRRGHEQPRRADARRSDPAGGH